jgi:hypothetical protein
MFLGPIPGYVPSPVARRVALDRFDELTTRMREMIDAGEAANGNPRDVAASYWATCHGHVSLEISMVGPADIDWETRLFDSLDALRMSGA